LGLVSVLLTGASFAQADDIFIDRGHNRDPGIIEVLNLVGESSDPTQVTQVIESTALPALYVIRDISYYDYDKINMPLSTWRKLARYFTYTGYQARLIHSIGGYRSLAEFYVTDFVDCVVDQKDCSIKYGDEIEMNWGYMFGLINKKKVPAKIIFQEANGFVNSQLLLANADFCKLRSQGLTMDEFHKYESAMKFLESVMPYTLTNQRPDAGRLAKEIEKCKPSVPYNPGSFYQRQYLQSMKCTEQSSRVVCTEI
jgi:hypothetical protein